MVTRRSLLKFMVSDDTSEAIDVSEGLGPDQQSAMPSLSTLAPVMALAVAACGGEDNSSVAPPPPPPVAIKKPSSKEEAVRFLTQAQLSASEAEATTLQDIGYVAWMDKEIAKPMSELAADAYKRLGGEDVANGDFFGFRYHTYAMWLQFINADDAMRKRMAFALSEFFVVGGDGIDVTWRGLGLSHYWDILNKHAFGNFRELLEDVTLNPMMGDYLSLNRSEKEDARTGRRPDENYAREVMQLFTIGLVQLNPDGTAKKDANGNLIPTYTNDDVTNVARALSGWAWTGSDADFNPSGTSPNVKPDYAKRQMTSDPALMLYGRYNGRPSSHSALEAKFLGATVAANTSAPDAMKIVLDTLFNHSNTAPFVAKQMIQRLVTSNPSPAYVQRIASVFDNNGKGVRGDMGAVFKAILIDDEARGSAGLTSQTFGKVREPFLRVVQWGRTFKLQTPPAGWYGLGETMQQSTSLGQMVLRAPSVFNFFRPGFVPAGTAIASNNLVAPEFQLVNEISTIGYANFMTGIIANRNNANLLPDYAAEITIANDSTALVNRIDLLMTGGQLSQGTKDRIKQAVDSIALPATNDTTARTNRVIIAITLTMVSPQYLVQK